MLLPLLFSLGLSAMMVNHPSYAEKLPHGCEVRGFGFNGTDLVINEQGIQSFYLIQNISLAPIELKRLEMQEVFMSPPLLVRLAPTHWGAFASDVANLHFQCFITIDEQVKQTDCRNVIEVCQYPRVKFALSNMGNYWVSSNKTQQEIIKDATVKGIYLRW